MCLPNFMNIHYSLFKILKNQTVTDGQMDGRSNILVLWATSIRYYGLLLIVLGAS